MIIDRIPAHIAALPEEEQGPALVREIHQRKELSMAWEYYASIPVGYDPFKATRAVLGIDLARGPEPTVVWYDEHLMTHETGFRRPMASFIHVGGRGYGKTATIEALRKWNSRPEAFIPHKAPAVGEIRWACKSPAAPVYAKGSFGWMMEQYASRAVPENPEYIRKLNAKVQAIHDILGVTRHDSNG